MKTCFPALLVLIMGSLLEPSGVWAQAGPEGGGHELQVWTGGGHGLNWRVELGGALRMGAD